MRITKRQRNAIERYLVACFAVTVLALAAGATLTATEREHGAHVHGVGQLNVAVEGAAVEIELIAPGADIVGFEHAAESAEDKAALADAVMALQDGELLFAFPPGAQCRLEEAEVESALVDDDHAEHDEHAEDDASDELGHGAKDAEHEKEGHAEFHAQYHFRCDDPDRLTHVDVKLFERFPRAGELEVQAVSPRGQSAQKLTPISTRLTF